MKTDFYVKFMLGILILASLVTSYKLHQIVTRYDALKNEIVTFKNDVNIKVDNFLVKYGDSIAKGLRQEGIRYGDSLKVRAGLTPEQMNEIKRRKDSFSKATSDYIKQFKSTEYIKQLNTKN